MKKLKKSLLSLTLVLLTVIFPLCEVSASSSQTQSASDTEKSHFHSITSNLDNAVQLTSTEVNKLVKYQINTYLDTELPATQKITFAHFTDWISLHDLHGTQFAYIVPLLGNTSSEVGFIVVSSIKDGFPTYLSCFNTEVLNVYREALRKKETNQAIFIPPFTFGILENDNTSPHVSVLNLSNNSFTDITDQVESAPSSMSNVYQIIRSSSNERKVRSILQSNLVPNKQSIQHATDSKEVIEISSSSVIEDVRLDCEYESDDSFVPIRDGSKVYYGCNQAWLDGISGYSADISCGVAAAANVLAYMADSDSEYDGLYPYSSLTKPNFVNYMKSIYDHFDPAWYGDPILEEWVASLVTFSAWNYGKVLFDHSCSSSSSKTTCANLIKQGLRNNKPVAAVNLALPYTYCVDGDCFSWHWVTITKYYQGSNDNRWIAVSSWGERYSLDWDTYWSYANGSILSGSGGFVYFD